VVSTLFIFSAISLSLLSHRTRYTATCTWFEGLSYWIDRENKRTSLKVTPPPHPPLTSCAILTASKVSITYLSETARVLLFIIECEKNILLSFNANILQMCKQRVCMFMIGSLLLW
jgi:hypothetical protein